MQLFVFLVGLMLFIHPASAQERGGSASPVASPPTVAEVSRTTRGGSGAPVGRPPALEEVSRAIRAGDRPRVREIREIPPPVGLDVPEAQHILPVPAPAGAIQTGEEGTPHDE